MERLRHESEARATSLDETLNQHLRGTLPPAPVTRSVPFEVKLISSGLFPDLDYTNLSELSEQNDGPWHR